MDVAPKISQDEEEGGQLVTMSKTDIEELVQREVLTSLLNRDCLKDEKIVSLEEKIKKMGSKIEDQRQETRHLRSEMDNLICAPSSTLPQNNGLFPTTHQPQRSISNIFRQNSTDNMPHDTFSLMMISTPFEKHWWYGFGIFVFQMTLCILIVIDQIKQSIGSSIFNVPFHVEPEVRLGQLMSIIFCVAIQSDVLISIQTLALLWKTTRWDKTILDRGEDTDPLATSRWLLHILLPNFMRLVEGILGLFVSFVVIVQSDNIIDLLRDFTALMIVSEVDNLGFRLAADGYIGKDLNIEAKKVKDITLLDRSDNPLSSAISPCNGFVIRPLILAAILICILGGWLRIVAGQVRGEIFYQSFPDCIGVTYEVAREHFGDGKCYGGNMNTLGCNFEGGDCINFNLEYPNCRGDDLVDVEVELANNDCNMIFAIEACGFDNNTCCSSEYIDSDTFGDGVCNFDKDFGANKKECEYENGDCHEYNDMYCIDENNCCPLAVVNNGTTFANGICNGGQPATSKCRFDGTDCNAFSNSNPSCPFDDLAVIDGSDEIILGDAICDSGVYSTEDCGWEFGDCAVGQIGQDLLDFPALSNTKMSADGSMLAAGISRTAPGHVQLFRYDSSKLRWIDLNLDLKGDSNGDRFGSSISMTRDGTRLAVSAPRDSINGHRSGQVKVFDIYSSTSQKSLITQVGQSIYGESPDDYAGYNIDLSADGSRLAIAAQHNTNNKEGLAVGQIRLFDLRDKSTTSIPREKEWVQVAEILGRNSNEFIGRYSLHLSPLDGSVVMFSVDNMNSALETKRIYVLGTTSTDSSMTAIQIGNDIPSKYVPITTTSTSAMSGDGYRIAIASNVNNPNEQGTVQVFDYNDATKEFDPVGGAIISSHDPETTNNGFGYSVAMSIDGYTLAISSVKQSCCATDAIELFAYDPISQIFRAAFPSPNQTGRSDNIIEEGNEDRHDSRVFGMQLSLAETVDSDDISSTSTWLSVHSYNIDTEKGYVKVHNLSEQFYPKCGVKDPSLIGNGECDSSPYNTKECEWDGGDCDLYNSLIDCKVDRPATIGNNFCSDYSPYNTEECGWDGGDCDLYNSLIDCKLDRPADIGSGFCHDYPPYNTEECGWDGGDCQRNPVTGYPNCFVHNPSNIGNGKCWDHPPYNTEECGWDGGDCDPP